MIAHPLLPQCRRLCMLILAVMLVLSVQPVLAAPARQGMPPQPPARFFGTVTLDGSPVPPGTEVRALIDGVVYAVDETTVIDGAAVYLIDVPADDPSTPNIVEGGQTADVVVFQVGGGNAQETGVWRAEEASELNLTALTPTPTPTRRPRPPVTIPEPSTLALFVSGVTSLLAMSAGIAVRRR